MTGRPDRSPVPHRFRLLALALALVAPAAATGCGADEPEAVATDEVAVCADLRARENELIRVANEALSALATAGDDAARAAALADGYGRLLEVLASQDPISVPGAAELNARLVEGQQAALTGLEAERDRFVAEVPAVPQTDEHGQAGRLQTALEKVFSELEPPRAAYVAAGLDDEIDADAACQHVTQRADPSS